MAITYDWYAPYWHRSGGASPNSQLDGRSYWVVSYEQHPENLTTTVYVEYRLQTYNGGPYGLSVSATGTAYINGSSIGSKTLSRNTQAGEGYKFTYGGSNSTTIYHNSDGSASFTFQGKSYSPNVETTRWTNVQTIYLPNIATSPTVSISGAGSSDSDRVIIGNNISVVLGNTQGRSTTITYPGGTYTTSSDGTYSLQIPTSLINSYTNTRTPQGTVSVSNSIGSNSVPCYMYISDSYKPEINTFSFNGSDSDYPTLEGMYVQNLTTPKFTGTATFKNGATIASSKINITNYSGTGSLNFSGSNFTYTASVPFSQSGTHTATSQITDSRSISSDVKTSNSVEVIPYQSPSVSASYVRCDYEGNADESNGKYMKLTLNYKYYLIWYYGNPSGAMNYLNLFASGDGEYFESYEADPSQGRSGDISCSYSKSFILDNGKEQTTDTVYIEGKRYFTKSGNTYTVINYTPGATITGTVYEGKQFALSDSKDIYYRFSDITGSSQLISIRTSPAYTLISRLHGDAGHGVTLGQVATETGFNCYLPAKFLNPNDTLSTLLDLIYPIGSIYMSLNDVSPSSFIGGTWERIPTGRFLTAAGGGTNPTTDSNTYSGRGNYTGQTSWYPIGETGGENDHQLTVDELPSHDHAAVPGEGPSLYPNWGSLSGWGVTAQYLSGNGGRGIVPRGENYYHNNVPPYLSVYMWKRTA